MTRLLGKNPNPENLSLIQKARKSTVNFWRPSHLNYPALPAEVSKMPAAERVATILRVSLLRTEYSISPGGSLRAWLKMNMALALAIVIPTAVVAPIVIIITNIGLVVAGGVEQISKLLLVATDNLLTAAAYALGTVVILSITLALIKILFRRSGRFIFDLIDF